jgi:glycosyltransferase involved in cell wall biosynthesis
MVKVHILFEFQQGPWGGGNQFLKSLKKYLYSIGAYDENVETSQVILFNSHQGISKVAKAKLNYPEKAFVHRIDGPIRLYSRTNDRRDNVIFSANRYLADATVFQSTWSRQQNHRLGLHRKSFETIIHNAPEPTVFNCWGKIPFSTQRKVRLIATSWSSNWKKGFDVYQWLDENLNFNKYEMTFVGNSPVIFKNIVTKPPLTSIEMANELKKNDIFIFASPIEACSNSLLEALHCGLPVIAADSSSNPELVAKAGEVFDMPDEIPQLLDKIITRYADYQAAISMPSADEVGRQYCDFISFVHRQVQNNTAGLKHFGWPAYLRVMTAIYRWKLTERASAAIDRIVKSK